MLQVEHGSLYPALHRLVKQGLISAKDGLSENNRKARYYKLTRSGHAQLKREAREWEETTDIISRFFAPQEDSV